MKITLPVGYSGKIYRQNARAVDLRPFSGCHLLEVEIEECSSQDVHLVAEWHQNWRFASAAVEITPYKAATTWLDDFRQSPSLARLIMVDGKFYSPMRQKEAPSSSDFTHPIVAKDLHYQMLGRGSRQTILGKNLDHMFADYSRAVSAAKGWTGFGVQAVLPPEGFAFQSDDLETQLRRVRDLIAPLLFVDGMLWIEIEEPCLVVRNEATGSRLCLGRKAEYRTAAHEMIFSFCEYDSAMDFMAANWKPKRINATLAELRVFKPEVFTNSTDLEEVKRGVKQFTDDAGKLLPRVSRSTADAWYDLRDGLKASRGKMSTHVATSMCTFIQRFLDALSNETIKIEAPERRTLELGKRIVDRWEMRPVQPSRSVARR
jgi:hypothetical protein